MEELCGWVGGWFVGGLDGWVCLWVDGWMPCLLDLIQGVGGWVPRCGGGGGGGGGREGGLLVFLQAVKGVGGWVGGWVVYLVVVVVVVVGREGGLLVFLQAVKGEFVGKGLALGHQAFAFFLDQGSQVLEVGGEVGGGGAEHTCSVLPVVVGGGWVEVVECMIRWVSWVGGEQEACGGVGRGPGPGGWEEEEEDEGLCGWVGGAWACGVEWGGCGS